MGGAAGTGHLSYDEAKALARNGNAEVRRTLARRTDLRPEILYFLAQDADAGVRRAIATNQATPRQADLILARDGDQEVRADLAGKIAHLAPGITANDQDRIRKSTYEALELLARDEITRVRQVVSEAIKDIADAPAEVIRHLALDSELGVSGPVLEFSPVLSEEDLLDIIETGPAAGGIGAIARRATVTETLADAIVAADDVAAIADLLGNQGAQIREQTLDELIERAPQHELWHAPLVKRPKLPARAATKLARFVADNLLETLEKRHDLDAQTLEAVREVVHHRLAGRETGGTGAATSPDGAPDFMKVPPPLTVAKRLKDAGKLDQKIIGKALHASDYPFVLAAVTVLSGVAVEVVQKILMAQSAKGVVALAWKAGIPMALAVQMQLRLGHIRPDQVLSPKGKGDYPMGEDEMNWQLEFFGHMVNRGG